MPLPAERTWSFPRLTGTPPGRFFLFFYLQISKKSTNLSHFSSVKGVEFITQEEEDVVIDNDLIGDR